MRYTECIVRPGVSLECSVETYRTEKLAVFVISSPLRDSFLRLQDVFLRIFESGELNLVPIRVAVFGKVRENSLESSVVVFTLPCYRVTSIRLVDMRNHRQESIVLRARPVDKPVASLGFQVEYEKALLRLLEFPTV